LTATKWTIGDDVDLPADLLFLRVGLGWIFPAGAKELDLDASCILLRYWHKEDHAFFNDLWTLDGSVRLSGDNRTGVSQGIRALAVAALPSIVALTLDLHQIGC
jgi:stress response protein SCP2